MTKVLKLHYYISNKPMGEDIQMALMGHIGLTNDPDTVEQDGVMLGNFLRYHAPKEFVMGILKMLVREPSYWQEIEGSVLVKAKGAGDC